MFVCQDRELKQLIQTTFIFIFSIGCLYELKFCEVSLNPKSNRCWKFQLILRNKKVLFLKNIWAKPYGQDSSFFNQQMAPWCANFWVKIFALAKLKGLNLTVFFLLRQKGVVDFANAQGLVMLAQGPALKIYQSAGFC